MRQGARRPPSLLTARSTIRRAGPFFLVLNGFSQPALCQAGVGLFILADHGNCETMLTEDGKPITSHSTTPVPFVGMVPSNCPLKFSRKEGGVADVAPTMLTYMGIEVPNEMTGKSFF